MNLSAASRRHVRAMALTLAAVAAASLHGASASSQGPALRAASTAEAISIPYAEVQPIIERSGTDRPAALRGRTRAEVEALWPAWIDDTDASIRARVAQGEEDTLVNLWLFGTSFTSIPAARAASLAAAVAGADTTDVLERRLDDLLDAIASPGASQRLQFARDVIDSRNIDPEARGGREQVRRLLMGARARVLAENRATDGVLAAAKARGGAAAQLSAHATIFQERGLSPDTSILSSFGVDQSLAALRRSGVLTAGSVRRVAIVGPGLDIINKADGHDFYPPQSIQPFAVIDSMLRLGLAATDGLEVTTFDVSRRVTRHLQDASTGAGAGREYLVHLPLATDERWTRALHDYWERWGTRIGEPARVLQPPTAAPLSIRAVRVRPSVLASIHARQMNVVVERLPLAAEERFDLVVATNILVYYDRFEQSLAIANIAAMLRPGGSLLSNTGLHPQPPLSAAAQYADVTYSDRQFDRFFWYQRH